VSAEPLRILIIDDEEPARRLLREYLAGIPGVAVAAECANGFEAVKAVAEHDPDLLLLDIQMPKLDGFEVLELLDHEVPVIFVTAHDEYSIRAFEVHAVDYLLKPFGSDRLQTAIERARERVRGFRAGGVPVAARSGLTGPSATLPETRAAREIRAQKRPLERVLVKDGARVHVIPVETIRFIEAQDDYVSIATAKGKHLKQQTLNELEAAMDARRFVRIHRSFLLNVDFLARVEAFTKDSRVAILSDGTQLPVSRSGYERLRRLL
jgi:two-component system LytT family response regulator